MYSAQHILEAIEENTLLMLDWFEYALSLENEGDHSDADLCLQEAVLHEEWKLLWLRLHLERSFAEAEAEEAIIVDSLWTEEEFESIVDDEYLEEQEELMREFAYYCELYSDSCYSQGW